MKKFKNNKIPKVLALIPILKQPFSPESAFAVLGGKPLLWYTLDQVLKADILDRIVVTSNDKEVLKYSDQFEKITTIKRPDQLTTTHTGIGAITTNILVILKERFNYRPDAVIVLYINTPLRKTTHIEKAIDTLTIFDVDTVISVAEELAPCYVHEKHGLLPIQKSRDLRIEKKAIYKETGAILLSKVDVITERSFHGKNIGHIVMLPEESIKIKSPLDLWLAEKIHSEWLPIVEDH